MSARSPRALRRLLAVAAGERCAWAAVAGCAGAIVLLSLVSDPQQVIDVSLWDKASHFLAYGVLGCLWVRALAVRRAPLRALVVGAACAALLGAALELAQGLIPERFPSVLDQVANLLGAAIGGPLGLLAAVWLRRLGEAAAGCEP